MEISVRELLGPAARGYCTKENEKKVMDAVLLEAVCEEIVTYLKEKESQLQQPTPQRDEIKPCQRSGDCSHERVKGFCLGQECGVYLPA